MEEKEKKAGGISRRQFLKASGLAAGGVAAGATLAACGGQPAPTATPVPPAAATTAAPAGGQAVQPAGGQAVQPAAGQAVLPAFEPETTVYRDVGFCCGSNAAAVDVKNGKIVRIRPLHYTDKFSEDHFNPGGAWTIKARGKTLEAPKKTLLPPYSISYKKRVYSPNRIKYPLKRVDWEPGGDPAKFNPQNRGVSKYKRISWEEAATLIAQESERIRAKYGGSAIWLQSMGHGEQKAVHARGSHMWAYEASGDGMYTPGTRNPDSWEGWYWGAKHFWGCEPMGEYAPQTNIILDLIENCEMHIMIGGDPETTTWGWSGQFSSLLGYFYTELGIKQVSVCPDVNYWTAVHADKWIPILPNTDVAMHFAIAYTWITEGTYDKEYVETHSIGFDKFSDYVLGKEDGVPKTPEWASAICGVPEWTIKALARNWASKKTCTGHVNGGPYIRAPFATETGRMEPALLAMQGVGKPGRHQVGYNEWGAVPPGYPLQKGVAYPTIMFAGSLTEKVQPQAIARMMMQKAILGDWTAEKPLTWYGEGYKGSALVDREGQFQKVSYPLPKEQGGSRLHMLWNQIPNFITSWQQGFKWIEAYRSPDLECIVMQNIWMEDDTLFADIVLPANTKFETEDIAADVMSGVFHLLMHEAKCIDPIGDTKSDYEGVFEVARKLGLSDEKYTKGKTQEQRMEDVFGFSGLTELTTWDQVKEKGYFVVPVDKNWESDWKTKEGAGMSAFAADPKKNPLQTPSGLFEFESQGLKEHFPDDIERPPVPHWIPGGPGYTHDERLSGERAKKYPLLIVSNHPRWRVHAEHDDIPWLREIPTCKVKGPDGYLYEPAWINPKTAAKYGIESGDIVRIYNDRGAVLGGAYVTERIVPGVVYQDHGARVDEIITGELDRGGANNCISPGELVSKNCTGMATSGYLVEIEKVTGAQVDEWRKKYPVAYARDYDPAYGMLFEGWIEKEA